MKRVEIVITVISGSASSAGEHKTKNEDVMGVDGNGAILVDGIGSTDRGCARLLARVAALVWHERSREESLAEVVERADRMVSAIESSEGIVHGGACGCFVAWNSVEKCIELANVGDTMAVAMEEGNCSFLFQPDRDNKGRVKQFLGSRSCKNCAIDRFLLEPKNPTLNLLLMSDGVWEYLTAPAIVACCKEHTDDPQAAAESLVQAARASGSVDDASALVLRFELQNREKSDGKPSYYVEEPAV